MSKSDEKPTFMVGGVEVDHAGRPIGEVPEVDPTQTDVTALENRIAELEAALNHGDLLDLENDYTVSGLQKLAKQHGLEDAGNKAELAARIAQARGPRDTPATTEA